MKIALENTRNGIFAIAAAGIIAAGAVSKRANEVWGEAADPVDPPVSVRVAQRCGKADEPCPVPRPVDRH
jgi:hypothetical protein